MIKRTKDLLIKGATSPSKIPHFLNRKRAELAVRVDNREVPSQRARIQQLLEQDEFLLVIFDACRYDSFRDLYHSYYSGDLEQVYTTNTYTKQYQKTMWSGEYDLTYVAGGPVISDRNFELSGDRYRPSEHFDEILDAWDMGYEKELGVTPPEAVTEVALERDAAKMVVHYFQPHAPYIGDVRLRDQYDASEGRSKIENRVDSLQCIYERIESGDIPEPTLREAYEANLHRVMQAAQPLVAETDHPTVITSDHGELLGEDGRYLHGGLPHPILCELPWLPVDEIKGELGDMDPSMAEDETYEKKVKDQLRDLGYLQ